jgi:nicotinamidase/pyrazinamidase
MRTVFIDVDSQLDFLYPAGALYVPGAEAVVPAIAQLNRHAAAKGIPIISTTDAHTENDPEFRAWPPHCVAGTLGQRKAEATLLEKRIVIPNRPGEVAVEGAPQVVVEKQTVDVFQTVTIRRIIEALKGDHFVIYGVVTEVCVACAARGLLEAGKRVTVVTDAIQALTAQASERTLEELRAAGARITGASALL